jgi:ribosomal protein S18 acetylase RimI-like enzyme
MISVRTATPADAAALAAFAGRIFAETFAKDNTAENMDAYLRSSFSPELQAREIVDPDFITVLAVAPDGDLAAYAQIVRNPVPPEVGDDAALELARFYVDQRWHGRGVAAQLMQDVIDRAMARGARTMWLGVWEHNHRAMAFYRKHGYREVGSHPFMLGDDRQTDLLMAVSLRSGSGQKPA